MADVSTARSPTWARRAFLRRAWRLTGAGLAGGGSLMLVRALAALPVRLRRIVLDEAILDRLSSGGSAVVDEVFVTGPVDEPLALRMRCTHLGCALRHDEASKELVCACHGSRFDHAGEPLAGPAREPLARARVQREGGRQVVLVEG